MNKNFNIEEYNYALPEEKIAKFPLNDRDKSKLLLWEKGKISHHTFREAANFVPENSLLVFNDTRVIAARLLFRKATGAKIELFLLHPELPTRDISESMTLQNSAVWLCMIGNKKKWKEGKLKLEIGECSVSASYHDRDADLIRLEWTKGVAFADIINKAGETPLPPYLKRKPEMTDAERYQTVYSKNNGAVAAPTAGLHFTKSVFEQLNIKEIQTEYLTLHVSAGTFKPVETNDFRKHPMHCEQIIIRKDSIEKLLVYNEKIIAVGTTSLRILESLYWYGVVLKNDSKAPFFIDKDLPYRPSINQDISFNESLEKVLLYMKSKNIEELRGETEIYIYPGYRIRSAMGIFTNFHLPKSTLLLLISAFTQNSWKEIYDSALTENYRFLSYGDSSLLFR